MSVFGEYAACYDLIYSDKDYVSEVAFASQLIEQGHEVPLDLLELGCGTGMHALLMAKRGHQVLGVDRSAEMLNLARARLSEQPESLAAQVELKQGDIAALDTGRQFDAALAFFHVVSYLTEDDALAAAFAKVHQQLKPGGRFLFDYWYGPAVVAQQPERRVRAFEDDNKVVERVMQPTWLPAKSCVAINISLDIRDKASGALSKIEERHTMRYFEAEELEQLLVAAGFKLCRSSVWLSDEAPSDQSWGACILAEAR